MKIGLCLCGGGAKGAYQAGVIKALYDRGINTFDCISGTSIGAINGYYIYTGNVEKLVEMWINIEENSENSVNTVGNIVDNSYVVDNLKLLNDNKIEENDFYVNYIDINNNNVCEKIVNVKECNKEEGINAVKYSSSLPYNPKSTLPFKEQFMKDISEGIYEGCKLDGGLVNNTLVQPLIKKGVDKIIVISTSNNYILSDEIKNTYNVNNIIVVKPKTIFSKGDTLRFDREFCKNIYEEGYAIGKSIKISI